MALPRITAEGNLTADSEYRQTRNGKTVASFRLAANESRYNEQTRQWEQTGACFLQCTAWAPLADNMYATGLAKGSPVVVTGRLETRTWQTEQGGAAYAGQPANNGIRDDDPWAQPTSPGNDAEPEF